MVRSALWRGLFSTWPRPRRAPLEGYSLLLLIPADLPVFLRLALDTCARQDPRHRVETLAIPDAPTPAFRQVFDRFRGDWLGGPLRMVELGALDRTLLRLRPNPHNNCFVQFVRGAAAARATHAVWHDADCFIEEPSFLRTHYETAVDLGVDCMGVSPVWDPWYAEHGYDHLVATWELLLRTEWLRSFRPWEHRGAGAKIDGQKHMFDITLLPQCLTAPERIARHEREWGFIHFNYVICTYRFFQQAKGPFEDEQFRILLVRLLADACDTSGWRYEAPSVVDLERGLTDDDARVTYRKPGIEQRYQAFRAKFEELIRGEALGEAQRTRLAEGIAGFDRALGWAPSSEPSPPGSGRGEGVFLTA